MPGTLVLIGVNSPRVLLGPAGLRSPIVGGGGAAGGVEVNGALGRRGGAGGGRVGGRGGAADEGPADGQKVAARDAIAEAAASVRSAEDGEHGPPKMRTRSRQAGEKVGLY